MKSTIEDIRRMLNNGLYRDEQHIRICIVARILQALGWNIWDPSKFYTEYPVITINANTPALLGNGRVDVAMGKSLQTQNERLFALIEVKALGNIVNNSRIQLQTYSVNRNQPISVLTDGEIWEFYLNTLQSNQDYTDRRFNIINLTANKIEDIISVFSHVLGYGRPLSSIQTTSRKMRKEFSLIQLIKPHKQIAESLFPGSVPDQITHVYNQLIAQLGTRAIRYQDVARMWNMDVAMGDATPPPPPPPPPGVKTDYLTDYTNKKSVFVIIDGGNQIPITTWAELKREVYNHIIHKMPNLRLPDTIKFSLNKSEFRSAMELDKGNYTERNLSATSIVQHCRKAVSIAGIDPKHNLIIGYK